MIKRNKKNMGVTISQDLYEWLDMMVREKEFASCSHGVELALTRLRREREGERP